MSDNALRVLGPQVLGALVRRGNEFAAAEDAVQEAMLEAHRNWTGAPPDDPKGWLSTVATHKLIDAHRSDAARRRREDAVYREREAGPTEQADDDTLLLLFLCCHPVLSPASAVALTLRAVGWLTTKEIADAFLVPEATMAQRIRRAKRTVAGQSFTQPADSIRRRDGLATDIGLVRRADVPHRQSCCRLEPGGRRRRGRRSTGWTASNGRP